MMAFRREKHSALAAIQPAALKAYLRSQGYLYREPWGAYLERYSRKVGGREDDILVPKESSISDYERRLMEATDSLSRQLSAPIQQIIRSIINSAYEVVRIAVNEGENESTIPYDTTIDLLRGGFALIDSSATLAVSQEHLAIIRGRRPDVVRRYLDEVRVGQTEVGSFVLTLLMPVSVNGSGLELPAQMRDGFGARVSQTFSASLNAAQEAVHGAGFQSNRALLENGMTANFSGGIARILEAAGDASISLMQPNASAATSRRALSKFVAADAERFRKIQERLTPKDNAVPFTVTGTVTEFKEPRGKSSGSIVVNCMVHGELRPVRLKFQREDRPTVVHAIEKKSDVFLEVDGDLFSKSGHFNLDRPLNFRTVRRGPLA